MVRVLGLFLSSNSCCSSRAVVPVSYIEGWDCREYLGDSGDGCIVINDPHRVSETVFCHKVVLRGFFLDNLFNDGVDFGVVRICEEYRLKIGVLDSYVNHAVIFLLLAGKLVLFDGTVHVIVCIGADYKAVLGSSVHCLGVNIVLFLLVLYQPAFLLPFLEVLYCLVISLLLVLIGDRVKINLRFDDVKQGFLSGLSLGFLGVENVVRT